MTTNSLPLSIWSVKWGLNGDLIGRLLAGELVHRSVGGPRGASDREKLSRGGSCGQCLIGGDDEGLKI